MDLVKLLERAGGFLENHSEGQLTGQLLDYYQRAQFKLAIVGGFSRGKSHFINRLLGSQILPESAVPTTGYRTEIQYGSEARLEVVYPDRVEEESFSPELLERFSLYKDAPGKVRLRLFLPLPVLQSGLVIIDTPGIEDPVSGQEDVSQETLLDADAAIVMVSAVAPFSLTECAFIREYMLDRKLPLIAAGVSFSDRVPEADRKKQLGFIIKRCHELYPAMKILMPDYAGVSAPDLVCGVDNILALLAAWQRLPELERLKRYAVLSRLKDAVEGINASLEARKVILGGDVRAARSRLSEAIGNLEDGSEAAMDLRLRFVDQAEVIKDSVRKDLRKFCDAIIGNVDGLSEEKVMDAAFELNGQLTEKVKAQLQRAVGKLASELEQTYGVPASLANSLEIGFSPLVLTRISLEEPSQNRWIDTLFQKGMTIGDIYATRIPGGALFWSAIKPHVRPMFEKAYRHVLGDVSAKSALKKEMNAICSAMGRQITEGIQQLYQDVFTGIKDARRSWLEQMRADLAENEDLARANERLANLEANLGEGEKLAREIDRQLGESK